LLQEGIQPAFIGSVATDCTHQRCCRLLNLFPGGCTGICLLSQFVDQFLFIGQVASADIDDARWHSPELPLIPEIDAMNTWICLISWIAAAIILAQLAPRMFVGPALGPWLLPPILAYPLDNLLSAQP
jgi:hypothetical protein